MMLALNFEGKVLIRQKGKWQAYSSQRQKSRVKAWCQQHIEKHQEKRQEMYPEAKPQRVLFDDQWSLDFILQGLNVAERFLSQFSSFSTLLHNYIFMCVISKLDYIFLTDRAYLCFIFVFTTVYKNILQRANFLGLFKINQ